MAVSVRFRTPIDQCNYSRIAVTMPGFVHLKLHTDASLVDGLVQLKPLIQQLTDLKLGAVGITDLNNFFNLVKFQKLAHGSGVKPIFGTDIWLQMGQVIGQVTLLAQSLDGYRQITRWLSKAYLENQNLGKPVVDWQWLKQDDTQGVILLSGGLDGIIAKAMADNEQATEQLAQEIQQNFPDRFYIELVRHQKPGEEQYIVKACGLAQQLGLPLVATNDVRFLHQTEFDVHEIRCAIHSGYTMEDPKRPKPYTNEQYFKTPEQMIELFADIPEAIANTVHIAQRCNVNIPVGINYLPNFEPPDGLTLNDYFHKRSHTGLTQRLHKLFGNNLSASKRQIYLDRLDEELNIIVQMGFPGYFLIVMDFIQWAKENGVPVGPGRGSGAGSLVAYVLDITDIDPIEYDLLFERFLNPERVSMPDFDVDFCMDGRDRVIEYVAQKYGRSAVSQIITFGTMAAKAVVRDVGRVLGRPYPVVDRISKMIPFEVGMTLSKALEQEESLQTAYNNEEEAKEILDLGLKLEGVKRNVGKHAGGVVIAPSALTDFVPLYCDDQGDNLVTQFDKDDVEQVGLVKFDFLGLRTLTIVDWAIKNIHLRYNNAPEHHIDITTIPLEDAATFKLLKASETTAVFQLESRGMKDLIKRLQPSSFEDIIALVALFRPGPLQSGMVDDFINRKHGRAEVEYPHPDVEPVLKNTYGVILYQEQVMQIAQVLANFTLGQADMLRRAMGKKKPEEMDKQRLLFVQGAQARDIDENISGGIFDLMEKFAGYGFNKSHSAAYALVSYQTAWLKTHYPAEFMAAVLSADMHNTDKIVTLVEECRTMEIPLRPPSVHYSAYKFTVSPNGEIIYGLGAIKGLGEGPIEEICQARSTPFTDFFDFCQRIDTKKLNKKSLDALIKSGALDELKVDRAVLHVNMSRAMTAAAQERERQSQGMVDLFANLEATTNQLEFLPSEPWSYKEMLGFEKDTLGIFLSGHPLELYNDELKHLVNTKIRDLRATERGKPAKIGGIVVGIRTMRNKRGDKIAFLTLDDRTGRMDISLFKDMYQEHFESLAMDKVFVVEGDVSFDDYSGQLKLKAKKLRDVDIIRHQELKKITLRGSLNSLKAADAKRLHDTLLKYPDGQTRFELKLLTDKKPIVLDWGSQINLRVTEELLEDLRKFWGREYIQLSY